MALFTSNEDFNDIQDQLQYVRSSLGYKVHPDEIDVGCSRRGDGFYSPFYNLYCDYCKMEIEKAWIDPDDEQKMERCPECKKYSYLCSKEERQQEIEQRIADLLKEESIMKQETKRWKTFRDKHPLNESIKDRLEYNENEQWRACRDGIDLQEYVINKWFIPRKMEYIKEKAQILYEKYCVIEEQRKKALFEKKAGNECFKKGNFKRAIKHYTKSIFHRTDFKVSYLNRALMYFKLAQYDECIDDCSLVIDMINIVNYDTKQLHLNELFKAYLRRSNALKQESKYEEAKDDVLIALEIKPKDGSAKRLLQEIKVELRRSKLRREMSHFDWDDESVCDFDKFLDLSIQFLSESIASANESNANESFKFEGRDSDELFRRLYVFMCRNKKYTVRFVQKNGIHFCLKYLHSKLKLLSDANANITKINLLLRPYSILTMCCEESVNLEEMKRKKHLTSIRWIILWTMKHFNEMNKVLAVQSMRFVSIIMSIESIRDNVALKSGKAMMQHFVKFQKNTNPKKQSTNAIRSLFEIFSTLFQCKNFRNYLYSQSHPYLYKIFLHSMAIYNEYIEYIEKHNKHAQQEAFDNLEYALSVILDGLGLIYDAESCLARSGYNNDDDAKLQHETKQMVKHFIENKNIETYMLLLTKYLKNSYLRYKEANSNNIKEKERYLSQLIRIFNVLLQISDPLYHELGSLPKLYQFNINKEIVLLMLIIDNDLYKSDKMRSMLKLLKYKILAYLDHVSDDKEFDSTFGCLEFDQDKKNKNVDSLPYFWKWIMDVFVEQYKDNQITPKLMEEFSMNKSRCIRTLYRFSLRRKYKSFIIELMIKKYFESVCEWLSYSDEQIMANVTLVITDFIKYSKRNNRIKKKYIKKSLTRKRLKDCLKLMTTKHHVIQYNAMLLMANIVEFDADLATLGMAIGATPLLECFKKQNQNKKQKHLQW